MMNFRFGCGKRHSSRRFPGLLCYQIEALNYPVNVVHTTLRLVLCSCRQQVQDQVKAINLHSTLCVYSSDYFDFIALLLPHVLFLLLAMNPIRLTVLFYYLPTRAESSDFVASEHDHKIIHFTIAAC